MAGEDTGVPRWQSDHMLVAADGAQPIELQTVVTHAQRDEVRLPAQVPAEAVVAHSAGLADKAWAHVKGFVRGAALPTAMHLVSAPTGAAILKAAGQPGYDPARQAVQSADGAAVVMVAGVALAAPLVNFIVDSFYSRCETGRQLDVRSQYAAAAGFGTAAIAGVFNSAIGHAVVGGATAHGVSIGRDIAAQLAGGLSPAAVGVFAVGAAVVPGVVFSAGVPTLAFGQFMQGIGITG